MALRAVTLTPAARRLTLSKDGWRTQVETTLAHAADALNRDELDAFAAQFDALESWADEQRAYQPRPRARGLGAQAKAVARRATPATGQTLSLVMIVKNEEEMLPGCLEAVRGAVDEMVVVDTGSTDRTVEIAESFGAKVVEFPWN